RPWWRYRRWSASSCAKERSPDVRHVGPTVGGESSSSFRRHTSRKPPGRATPCSGYALRATPCARHVRALGSSLASPPKSRGRALLDAAERTTRLAYASAAFAATVLAAFRAGASAAGSVCFDRLRSVRLDR